MMMKKPRIFHYINLLLAAVMLTSLLSLLPSPGDRAEAAPGDGLLAYETSFAGSDILKGSSERQEFFTLMGYWDVREVTLTLDYQVAQITREHLSSITLSLNGNPFLTFRPSEENGGPQRMTVTVPKGFLKKDVNTLSIQGYLRNRTEEGLCTVDNTPDNWLHLYNTSGIVVRYTDKGLDGGIADFTERMTGIDTVRGGYSLVAVPEQATSAELEAAVYALSGFAGANTLADKTLPLLPYRGDSVQEKRAVTLVGAYDRLPPAMKGLLGKDLDLGSQALIQLVNKETGQPTLIVTSRDEKLLVKAGRLLANHELTGQLTGDRKIVDADTDVGTPAIDISANVSFTETGDKLTGPNHQERTYFVPLPANRSIADSGKLSLHFRYAQNLDFDRSLVTVSINGTPIGSKKLTRELANGDTLNLPVPKNLNISGNFSVTVAFDLELPGAQCTPDKEQMPWAYIGKDSLMKLTTKDRTELLFNNYPYPFLRDGVYNHVAVVLPDNPDNYTYGALAGVFNLLGRYAEGNTGDVRFYKGNADTALLSESNIIAIGKYSDNKIIRDNNGKLYFRFNQDGTTLVPNEKMSIDSDYGATLGTLQLIDSPYSPGRGLLAVTGVRSDSYYSASRLLATERGRWKVYGDGVTVDRDGKVNPYRFKIETGASEESVIRQIARRGDVLSFTVALVLVLALVLVSLLLLIRKHKKKRGDRS